MNDRPGKYLIVPISDAEITEAYLINELTMKEKRLFDAYNIRIFNIETGNELIEDETAGFGVRNRWKPLTSAANTPWHIS